MTLENPNPIILVTMLKIIILHIFQTKLVPIVTCILTKKMCQDSVGFVGKETVIINSHKSIHHFIIWRVIFICINYCQDLSLLVKYIFINF